MKYIVILFLILSRFSFPQVNTEKYRNFTDTLEFAGVAKLDASIQTGNTDLQELGSEIHLYYKKGSSAILSVLKGEYGWNNGDEFSNEALAHLRFVQAFTNALNLEIFSQVNYDKSLLLLFRALGGIGLRINLFNTESSKLWFGSAYMFEYEKYEKPRRRVNRKELLSNRWSNYFSYNLSLQKNLFFSSVIYYQPRFDLFKDARILSESSLIVNLSGSFSLSVEIHLRYDHFPPEGIKNFDSNSTLGFIINF